MKSKHEFLKLTGMVMLSALLAFALLSPRVALGSSGWPERPVTLFIGFAAGGGTDTVHRAQAAAMEKISGATINCVIKTGAVGSVATKFVWNKPADGYWWVANGGYGRTLRGMGYIKTIGWKDWQHYACATSIQGWAVSPDSPYKDLGDLIEAAKKRPGKITSSIAGIGNIWHMGNILLTTATGIKLNVVPYKGGAPATLAALQGDVDFCSSGIHEQVQYLRAGKLRNLAVFTDKPLEVEGVGLLRPVTDFVPELKPRTPWGSQYTIAIRRDVPVEILKKIKEWWIAAMDDPDFSRTLKRRVLFKKVMVGAEADKEAARQESMINWMLWDLHAAHIKVNPKDLGIPRPEAFEDWWPPEGYRPRIP